MSYKSIFSEKEALNLGSGNWIDVSLLEFKILLNSISASTKAYLYDNFILRFESEIDSVVLVK
jgi:hypothetical protein